MNEQELLVVMKCGFCFTTVAHSSATSAVSVDMLRSGMICLQHVLKLNHKYSWWLYLKQKHSGSFEAVSPLIQSNSTMAGKKYGSFFSNFILRCWIRISTLPPWKSEACQGNFKTKWLLSEMGISTLNYFLCVQFWQNSLFTCIFGRGKWTWS